MMLVDANVLLHAVNRDSPRHEAARAWLQERLSDVRPVALPWVVLLAFVRIVTNPRIFIQALGVEEALAYVDSWLAQPCVCVIEPLEGHWDLMANLCCGRRARPAT